MNRINLATMGRCFLALILVLALERNLPAETMVYTGLVVTDVRVGSTFMHNASLKITFEGDTNNIAQVPVPSTECGGVGYFFYLTKGVARMEFEYQGRTRTARLHDGQIFVALDDCNGGIGFGSFTGPTGLEPAYPLAFTLGTAEYAAVNDLSPLTTVLSTTGDAWSCIGYPPGGDDALKGTASGNCSLPDDPTASYPLKSDIGDIFVYQPYYETDGSTGIESNHTGTTNRGAFLVRPKTNGPSVPLGASGNAPGVVYTLQTVADGSLGGHVFNQALVTFQMTSETKSVTTKPSPVAPTDSTKALYENRTGYATVTVDDGGKITTAEFAPGEVYVRYDTGAGIAGFGSKISPTYPIALNCSSWAYPTDSSYTQDCLQGEAWNFGPEVYNLFHSGILAQLSGPYNPSPGVQALPQSLSQSTLLTGSAHACAGVYSVVPANENTATRIYSNLGVCDTPAPRGLHTNKGQLFLQDTVGGTNFLFYYTNNVQQVFEGGWVLGNTGWLHVEVSKGDD